MELDQQLEYVGFWKRVVASLVDTVLMLIVITPALLSSYGPQYFGSEKFIQGPADFVLSYLVPALVVIAFWTVKQATPGKMLYKAKIVDAQTGGLPSTLQYVIRYMGYFVCAVPLGLGLLWVAWDSRKQGWHDKLAGTVVVRPKGPSVDEVRFPEAERSEPKL